VPISERSLQNQKRGSAVRFVIAPGDVPVGRRQRDLGSTIEARGRCEKETDMLINEGKVDGVIRVVAAIGLIALVFVGPKTWVGWVGIIPLVTGLVGTP
jgi:hypothetical protein